MEYLKVCLVCSEPLFDTQQIQRLPPNERVGRGPKSGALGIYPDPAAAGQEEEIVHYPACCPGFFSPDGHPYIFDMITESIRESMAEEMREEIKEEYREAYKEGTRCTDCLRKFEGEEEEENEMCPFCKDRDPVWTQWAPTGGQIFFCSRCQKSWDAEEEELEV